MTSVTFMASYVWGEKQERVKTYSRNQGTVLLAAAKPTLRYHKSEPFSVRVVEENNAL